MTVIILIQLLTATSSLSNTVFAHSHKSSAVLPMQKQQDITARFGGLDSKKLSEIARSITVKVLVGEVSGSGIIIRQAGGVYKVLTNEHVLDRGDKYQIVTSDGQIYPAFINKQVKFNGNDLALLEFNSNRNYSVASIDSLPSLKVGDEVFAVGFPQESGEFKFTTGQVTITTKIALEGGYKLGYTNDIEKGMSGGPVLNNQGKVVAVNGMHAEPIWGNPYTYEDGSKPCPSMRKLMERSAFGIPIEIFHQLADSRLSKLPNTSEKSFPYISYSTLLLQQQASIATSCTSDRN
ncbi:MAG: serine protease [Cyanobacteria bacterium J06635_10]